jgi:glycosyltransferase involved in cell wall biosynthesis
MTRTRILFVGPVSPPVTGQSLACDVLLEALELHYDIELVNLAHDKLDNSRVRFGHVLSVLGKVRRVHRGVKNADIIYYTGAESIGGNLKDVLIYIACLGKLPRMVMHLHGGAGMRRLMRGRTGFFRALNRPFLSRFGAVIVLGERLRDVFLDAVPDDKLEVVANFSEDAFFTTAKAIAAKFADSATIRMLFLSNMLPGKGHTEIVEAYSQLTATERDHLVIDFAGRFDSEMAQSAFLEAIRPFANLQYRGVVRGAEKKALLSNAHIFALPTYYPYEGQPISILEAFASGCAVVTTDHSGIFDTFTDGVNGIAVEKQSAPSLAAAFRRIIADPQALAPVAATNLAHAKARFTTDRYTKDLLAIIARVAGRS